MLCIAAAAAAAAAAPAAAAAAPAAALYCCSATKNAEVSCTGGAHPYISCVAPSGTARCTK